MTSPNGVEARGRYRLAEGVTFQELGPGEDTIILAIESGQLYTCNATTTDLLRHLEDGLAFDAAIDALLERYEVDRETLSADMGAMIDELVAERLIVRVEA